MKLLLFTFLLLPTASSAQAPAPRQADGSGAAMPVLGQARPGCTSVLRQVVGPEQRRPGQRLDQQPRKHDHAPLVGLRRTEGHHALNLRRRLGHRHPTPQQVDVAHPQRSKLAPSQAGVCQKQDVQPVRSGRCREPSDLVMGQEALLLPSNPR